MKYLFAFIKKEYLGAAWTQFFKNIPMALIVFVLIFSDIFTKEYRSGTLLLVLIKGLKGIDVSNWQGKPSWAKDAGSGVKSAILKVCEKNRIDSSFEHDYKGCKDNDILVGVCKYSYALTVRQVREKVDPGICGGTDGVVGEKTLKDMIAL